MYGKKQARAPHLIFGVIALVYPYFIGNPLWALALFVLLLGALWLAVRLGW